MTSGLRAQFGVAMSKIVGFLRRHDFFDPRPSFWNLAILIYFVDTILFAIPFSITYPASVYVDLALALTWFPGFVYAFGEAVKVVDVRDPALLRVRNVMAICLITFVFFGGVLRSLNNMVASVGGQFPFYSILLYGWGFAEPIVTFVIGIGAILIRRRLPFSPFKAAQEEKPVEARSGRRSPAWFLEATGILLIFSGIVLGQVYVIALEALILLVLGLILLPTGFLIRKITKPKSATPDSE